MLIALDAEERAQAGHMAEDMFIRQMKRRRADLGLSQGELADRVGALGGSMYQQTIAKLEAGQRSLKLSEAELIALALGTTVQDMLASTIGVSVREGATKPRRLEELKIEKADIERLLADLEEQHTHAHQRWVQTMAAREAAEVEARDAELRLREIQARGADMKSRLDFLNRRIREARRAEESTQSNSVLDAVLHEAEPAITALDGVTDALGADEQAEEGSPFAKLGRTLERARLAKELSLIEVSEASRVPISIILRIEHGDFSTCNGDVHARAILRALARPLELDPLTLQQRYETARGGQPQGRRSDDAPKPLTADSGAKRRRRIMRRQGTDED